MEYHPILLLLSVDWCSPRFVHLIENHENARKTINQAIFLQYNFVPLFIYVWQLFWTVLTWNLMYCWCCRGWLMFPPVCGSYWKFHKMLEQQSTKPYSCNSTLIPYPYMYDKPFEHSWNGILSIYGVASGWLVFPQVCGSDWKILKNPWTSINHAIFLQYNFVPLCIYVW